jgi:hypothetical protein
VPTPQTTSLATAAEMRILLNCVSAWLIVNSMRSEKIQASMLALQNLNNVWRKKCFVAMLQHHTEFGKGDTKGMVLFLLVRVK